MTQQQAKALIIKYNKGECTESERALLDTWLTQLNQDKPNISEEKLNQISRDIQTNLFEPRQKSKIIRLSVTIAAIAALTIIALNTWLYRPMNYVVINKPKTTDIRPGTNRATLKLSNGKTMELRNDQNGIIVSVNTIQYNDSTRIQSAPPGAVQTITTPKGGQYQIELPDHTKVWLNAETALEYTADLNSKNNERRVQLLSGEAYFEVAKDTKKPFIVISGDQQVLVLGTHFNISAYPNQKTIKTSLLEGSVKVTTAKGNVSKSLRPGQQAINSANRLQIKKADTELETAWKRGKTEFENADLKTVMGMLERWYDVETIYQTSNTESRFTGTVSRNKNITAVLQLLESTGEVHFKIQGRKVIVMK
ncbi:MAG TPA: FecR domain-containing protein [Pedobacter sp.]|nr:FecR domain-containing protein [Pedobacter sp.]